MRNLFWRLAPLLLLASSLCYANDQVFCGAFDGPCLPLIDTGNPVAGFVSNNPPVVAAPSLMIFDSADMTLNSAVVQLTANFHAGEDVLGFTDQAGISGSFDSATGTLILTGTAPTDAYQAALASVTYSDGAVVPQTDVRTLQWTVSNGAHTSAPAQSTATANNPQCPTNLPPVPSVIVNEAYGPGIEEVVPLIQNGATGCDLGTGCALHIPLDGTIPNVMDASGSHNPGNCGSADSALTYHWELRFPPAIISGGVANYSGVQGADTGILNIVPSGLPAISGADVMYRVILTITNANNPSLSTIVLFRFQYDSSECVLNYPFGDCP